LRDSGFPDDPLRLQTGNRGVLDFAAQHMKVHWMSDETDDDESDLETENLSDLEDEFYQRKKDPVP
jgi:hypothetical protein